jgi:uncharacterized protein
MEDVYHSGEREIQNIVGEVPIADRNGAIITDTIVKGAINFIEKQPMAIVSSKNNEGELWTSLLIGNFGFTKVPNPNSIVFEKENICSNADDIFYTNIQSQNQIGSLFIELDTRRRFRINGLCSLNNSQIDIKIKEAYPNCPKYIQRRVISLPEYFKKAISNSVEGIELSDVAIKWITNADTFFVGSTSIEGRLDASHRGGNPNFIEVLHNGTLKIPDYSGNSLYNTFGNIVQNQNTGLLFIDFDKGETLQLTGKSTLLFNQHSETDLIKTKGTGRYWLFKTSRWIHTINHHKVDWTFLEYSPFNP